MLRFQAQHIKTFFVNSLYHLLGFDVCSLFHYCIGKNQTLPKIDFIKKINSSCYAKLFTTVAWGELFNFHDLSSEKLLFLGIYFKFFIVFWP